ncbi:hypothetical protein KSP39_PZI000729 [Platanthera zijinensis]|uniref:Uncharacterized protein n=1 Tax=Platanthera zijinensis TaxID=2320716 RepID=A0AAP0C2D4_9ASPA
MQQRRATVGRPSGTDGFDFSYRMVVDSRYTKVAKGKSRLKSLLLVQTILQAIGFLLIVLDSQEKGFGNLVVVSISAGFISLFLGELGRRRSQANLLRLYLGLSALSAAFNAAHVVRSDLFLKVTENKDISSLSNYELGEVVHALLCVVLQVLAIITTVGLVQNMSPKRTS